MSLSPCHTPVPHCHRHTVLVTLIPAFPHPCPHPPHPLLVPIPWPSQSHQRAGLALPEVTSLPPAVARAQLCCSWAIFGPFPLSCASPSPACGDSKELAQPRDVTLVSLVLHPCADTWGQRHSDKDCLSWGRALAVLWPAQPLVPASTRGNSLPPSHIPDVPLSQHPFALMSPLSCLQSLESRGDPSRSPIPWVLGSLLVLSCCCPSWLPASCWIFLWPSGTAGSHILLHQALGRCQLPWPGQWVPHSVTVTSWSSPCCSLFCSGVAPGGDSPREGLGHGVGWVWLSQVSQCHHGTATLCV